MPIEVRITNPNEGGATASLKPGDAPFVFGRQADGAGRLRQGSVSRLHGHISITERGFAVTSLGSKLGIVVADLTTPSVLVVPVGCGPIEVPFADARLMVDQRRIAECLIVEVSGSAACDLWRDHWGSEVRGRWMTWDGLGTAPPWQHMKWSFRNGNVMSWFRTLVAMCEPELTGGVAPVPTNVQLAERLYVSLGVIERNMTEIHQQLDVQPGPGSRERLVQLATRQGFVTGEDVRTVLASFPKRDR